jgi:opacity protein-like surface antigen
MPEMNKTALALIALFAFPALAQSEPSFYVSGAIGTIGGGMKTSDDLAGNPPTAPHGAMGGLDTGSKRSFALAVGYQLDPNLQVEVSYGKYEYGDTDWGTDFSGTYNGATATPFSGKLSSDVLFVGVNYLGDFAPNWNWQVGAAVGMARNKFHRAAEGTYAEVRSNAQNEFAFKVSAGLGYKLSEHLKVLGNVDLVSLGRFESAKQRDVDWSSTPNPIAPYKFDTNLQPVVSLGLSYSF